MEPAMSQPGGDHFQISVGGAVGGNVVVGRENQIISSPTNAPKPSAAELTAFRSAVDQVKARLATEAPADAATEAAAHLDELHAAATAPTPDVSTMVRVRDWFVDHLPTFIGAVTGLLVHPVVGALVKSAGDAVSAEFHRRLGTESAELPRD
jgi:pyrimidine deaminase RibD-like protein